MVKVVAVVAVALRGASADQSICTHPDGTTSPCQPGNQECSRFGYGLNTPQFHVRDNSCSENDPNGPSYDPTHGVYHLHYQNHVGLHGGRTYGHAVSRDLAHWAHMPISIWNDHAYDDSAIYTGSATIVNGQTVQVYPGLCNTRNEGCPGGTNLCIAVPADPSDPLQTKWTKEEYTVNPIVNATQRDPSTAWQNPSGEWQLTTFDTVIYASMDFKIWYKIDTQPGFARGECPSFFPLPRTTPGAGPAPAEAETPTHVHKASHGGDWMNVGTYVPGEQGKVGTFSQTPGVPFTETKIDMGKYYASKDFYDPAKKRRINWGWAQVAPGSTQSMPREVTWNPELQQLVHSPIEEQANLREEAIGSLKSQTLPAGKVVSLSLPQKLGNQSEIRVSFARPSVSTTLSVKVMGNGGSLKPPYAREMPGYDLAGGDYSVTNVDYKDFKICEAACDADDKCVSWTYVVRGPKYASCCLKGNVPKSSQKSTCTSGVKSMDSELTGGTDFSIDYRPNEDGKISSVKVHGGSFSDTLKLSPNDKTIDMDLYVDNTFTEAYFMNGRVAMTVPTGATNDAAVGVSSSADGVTMNSATAWHVSPIWVTPEDVKKTPRLDRQPIITV